MLKTGLSAILMSEQIFIKEIVFYPLKKLTCKQ